MLHLKEIHVSYGPIEVLKGISLEVEEGAIVCLIGANGAGKTTTLNAVSGLLTPTRGEIEFLGQRVDGLPPEKVVSLGIVQVPEGRKVFRNLTVHECLLMGGLTRRDKKALQEDLRTVYEMFPILSERRRQLSGTLSGGEQQMLAFGRALAAAPKLLLLDEPSMGLAPRVVEDVARFITGIREKGVTVLLVEQNAELALSLSDYGYVMETGRIIFNQPAGDLLMNQEVRRAYLGI